MVVLLQDTKIIPSKDLPRILVEEIENYIQPIYPDLYAAWQKAVQNPSIQLSSLQSLVNYFESKFGEQGITVMVIRYHLQMYAGSVAEEIEDSINKDLELIRGTQDNESANKDLEFVYTNVMDKNFNVMRDIISNKNKYKQKSDNVFQAKSVDSEGTINAYAEVRKDNFHVHQLQTKEETDQWLSLVAETLTSLDEWTADLFDMICFCWSSQEKDKYGYIEFHSDDALQFKYRSGLQSANIEKRERERFNIMKRVAALTNIWVSLRGDKIRIIGDSGRKRENDVYDFTEFKRMFEIGGVKIAKDKRTGESKGIYALTIKPAPLLMDYIADGKYTLGVMDLKVFEYSHYRQRDHKRLMRYLSYIWKARISNNTLTAPIAIYTLLEAIDLPKGYSGSAIRDRLETVLDDLQTDGVIQQWSYIKPVDETKIGKKGWVKNYWSNLTLSITPPERIVIENKKELHTPPKMIREPNLEQLVLSFDDVEDVLTTKKASQYETVEDVLTYIREVIKNGGSIRKIANEIGISHPTIIRWLDGNGGKSGTKTLDKMKAWILSREGE